MISPFRLSFPAGGLLCFVLPLLVFYPACGIASGPTTRGGDQGHPGVGTGIFAHRSGNWPDGGFEQEKPGAFAEATSTGLFVMDFVCRRAVAEPDGGRFRWVCCRMSSGAASKRKPRLLLALAGSFQFRFEAWQFAPLLFQLPPRITRSELCDRLPGFLIAHSAGIAKTTGPASA